mgnify:CR=1 FL=1
MAEPAANGFRCREIVGIDHRKQQFAPFDPQRNGTGGDQKLGRQPGRIRRHRMTGPGGQARFRSQHRHEIGLVDQPHMFDRTQQ